MVRRLAVNVVVCLLLAGTAGSEPQYKVVILHCGYPVAAYGVSGGQQVGQVGSHAALWSGTPESYVDLNPIGFDATEARSVSGGQQAGCGVGAATGGATHALLWSGTAADYVDLNPFGFHESWAYGVSGGRQVGYGWGPTTEYYYHAFLWSGTAESCVDLHPIGPIDSWAYGISGSQQVGWCQFWGTGIAHALLWFGTAASCVDLHPPSGFTNSVAFGVGGGQQVGCGWGTATGGSEHALLWSGTAESWVDLNPTGFMQSEARGVSGGRQVGYGYGYILGSYRYHALLWSGTADSYTDLHAFLPPEYNHSFAYGIDSAGNIVGSATPGGAYCVILWVPEAVPTPEELLPDLIEDVVAGNTQPDGGTSLLAKLAAALHNLTREDPAGPPNYAAAINALKAFINEVKAQRGKTITQEDADHWIALAQQIIDQLSDK